MITGLLYLYVFTCFVSITFFIVAYTLKLAETDRWYIVTGYRLNIFVGARTDGDFPIIIPRSRQLVLLRHSLIVIVIDTECLYFFSAKTSFKLKFYTKA